MRSVNGVFHGGCNWLLASQGWLVKHWLNETRNVARHRQSRCVGWRGRMVVLHHVLRSKYRLKMSLCELMFQSTGNDCSCRTGSTSRMDAEQVPASV